MTDLLSIMESTILFGCGTRLQKTGIRAMMLWILLVPIPTRKAIMV